MTGATRPQAWGEMTAAFINGLVLGLDEPLPNPVLAEIAARWLCAKVANEAQDHAFGGAIDGLEKLSEAAANAIKDATGKEPWESGE